MFFGMACGSMISIDQWLHAWLRLWPIERTHDQYSCHSFETCKAWGTAAWEIQFHGWTYGKSRHNLHKDNTYYWQISGIKDRFVSAPRLFPLTFLNVRDWQCLRLSFLFHTLWPNLRLSQAVYLQDYQVLTILAQSFCACPNLDAVQRRPNNLLKVGMATFAIVYPNLPNRSIMTTYRSRILSRYFIYPLPQAKILWRWQRDVAVMSGGMAIVTPWSWIILNTHVVFLD